MSQYSDNPYVGPRTFTKEERHLFFGREHEARELLSLVVSERLVLFCAQSGAGKSSLINTRLSPNLEAKGFEVLPVSRVSGDVPPGLEIGNIFVYNLLFSLDQSEKNLNRFAGMTLTDFLVNLTTDGERYYYDDSDEDVSDDAGEYEIWPRALIIDQFEEIFTTHPEAWEERGGFFEQLRQALEKDDHLWVVLTMREDHVAALDPYAHLLPGNLRTRYYMQRMGKPAALAAIQKPAAQGGCPFAPGVAEALVDDLCKIRIQEKTTPRPGQFVEPVQLQVVCYQLWENLRERPVAEITYQDLQELGDVDIALAQFYEQAIDKVLQAPQTDVSEPELRDWFNRQLITEARTRGTVYQGKEKTGGLANEAIHTLEDQFLIRAETRAGGRWYELVHDRFIEPILEANQIWLQKNPLIQAAQAWKEEPGEDKLYRGKQLEEALAAADQQISGALVIEFLETSQEAEEARKEEEARRQRELEQAHVLAEEQRQRAEEQASFAVSMRKWARWLAGVGLVAILLAIVAVTFGVRSNQNANLAATREAEARYSADLAATREVQVSRAEATAIAERKRADEMIELIFSRRLASQAEVLLEQNPQLAILLALESRARVNPEIEEVAEFLRSEVYPIIARAPYLYPPLETTLSGHTAAALSVAWSPDGSKLASASEDGTIVIWDVISGQAVTTLKGHFGWVRSVTWSPDGRKLASASYDCTVRIWDVSSLPDTGFIVLEGHTDWVRDVAWSPDGSKLASASDDETVIVWDTANGQPVTTLQGHTALVRSVAWSPDGGQLASASEDLTIRIWDVANDRTIRTLEGHAARVLSVAWSPDGSKLASASADTTVILWDITAGQGVTKLEGHTATVWSVAWSLDGSKLASASADQTVMVWDTASGQPVTLLQGHTAIVLSVAWSPDGSKLASASEDNTVILWDMTIGRGATTLQGHSVDVLSVAWSPNGSKLASTSEDHTIIVWDMIRGQATVLEKHIDAVLSVAWSPDGSKLASASADQTIRVWNVDSDQAVTTLRGHTGSVWSVAWSPDGNKLASASGDQTIIIWDVASRQAVTTLEEHTGIVWSVAWSPDGSKLASASEDQTIIVWDVASGQTIRTVKGHTAGVSSVAWSPDGSRLASASYDQTVMVWDVSSLPDAGAASDQAVVLQGHAGAVLSVAWSPDGSKLASASADQTVMVWDTISGQLVTPLQGHLDENAVSSVAWSPDGDQLASASEDGTVRVLKTRYIQEPCQLVSRNLRFVGEWEKYLPDQPYRATCPNHPVIPYALVAAGRQLALTGDVAGAIVQFQEAIELAPDILELEPEVEVALIRVQEGEPGRDDVEIAIDAYGTQTLDPARENSAGFLNALCWEGSLWGYADQVIAACEQAASLRPNSGPVHDSLALAQALTEDLDGAIEHFTFAVERFREFGESEAFIAKREAWIATLKSGRNPFDADTLEYLRKYE